MSNTLTCGQAILIHMRATNDSSNSVIVSDSIRQLLENDEPDTLSTTIAIGTRVEGEALPIRAEKIECGHWHHGVGCQDQAGAGGESLGSQYEGGKVSERKHTSEQSPARRACAAR